MSDTIFSDLKRPPLSPDQIRQVVEEKFGAGLPGESNLVESLAQEINTGEPVTFNHGDGEITVCGGCLITT